LNLLISTVPIQFKGYHLLLTSTFSS
jgi:hypothetical protein